jgi:hypothetical protein
VRTLDSCPSTYFSWMKAGAKSAGHCINRVRPTVAREAEAVAAEVEAGRSLPLRRQIHQGTAPAVVGVAEGTARQRQRKNRQYKSASRALRASWHTRTAHRPRLRRVEVQYSSLALPSSGRARGLFRVRSR